MRKFGNTLLVIVFVSFITVMGFLTAILPPKEASFFENRKLADFPQLSVDSVMKGTYFKKLETYVVDHFAGRDNWLKMYKKYQISSNQVLVDDYYINKDNLILATPIAYFPKEQMDKSVGELNDLGLFLKNQGKSLYFMSLPNKMTFLNTYLPDYIDKGRLQENKEYFLSSINKENVTVFDIGKQMEQELSKDEMKNMFFKTDHHWNMDGAFMGYQKVIQNLEKSTYGRIVNDIESLNYEKSCLDDKRLLGSWNKQLYGMVKANDEIICYYNPEKNPFSNLLLYKGPIVQSHLWSLNNIYAKGLRMNSEKIDYGKAYMTDYRELTILNKAKEGQPNVLVIKDSYANPIALHLAQHFHHTTIYDMRFNKDRNVYDYILQNDFDMVLVLYNDSTIFHDMFKFKKDFK